MQHLKRFLTSLWLLCSLLTLLLLAASLVDYPTLRQLDLPIYDHLARFRPAPVQHQVVLITIDQRNRSELGEISASRSRLARLLKKLEPLGIRQLALLSPLSFTTEETAAFDHSQSPARSKGTDHLPGLDQALLGTLTAMRPTLALEEKQPANFTADRLSQADLLPQPAEPAPILSLFLNRQNPLAEYRLLRPKMRGFLPPAPEFQRLQLPLGHLRFPQDPDGKIRSQRLLLPTQTGAVPSLPLLTILKSTGLELGSLQLPASNTPGLLRAKTWQFPVGHDYRLLLNISELNRPYSHYSASQLLSGELDHSLTDKIVLLGTTAGIGDHHLLANYGEVNTAELAALATASLLAANPVHRPSWGWLAESLVLLYFTLLLLLLVPRLGFRAGLLSLSFFLSLWFLAATIGLVYFGFWLQLAPAFLLCSAGFILVRWRQNQRERELSQLDNNRLLALSFQEQGLLDLALDKALHLPPKNKSTREMLYNLGLDFERKRMPHKAQTAYRHLLQGGRFRDTKERLKYLGEHGHSDTSPSSSPATLVLSRPGEKPTLGRYQIEKELGQGAMGTVYLGVDPKINRQVAIKTLDYQQIEPDQLQSTKERFFSEAEAAGRLNHPQIVTIYDVGEENDLAFLAMELLSGKDLSYFCRAGQRLPPPQVLSILAQVASALDYAHQQGVIHRDIKPANLLVLANSQIKVVDFGIAQVASRTQTETGIILGTPSYMSPEQLSGKKVDGRSDLFSLGVVMYELLSGEKPFSGENLAALMYNISRCDYRPLTESRPRLPRGYQEIISKLLIKAVSRRYKTAAALARELRSLQQRLEKK